MLILGLNLYAKSDKLSPISLPSNVFINLSPNTCDKTCMKKLLSEEKFFSFISLYSKDLDDKVIEQNYQKFSSLFSILPPNFEIIDNFSQESGQVRLAILLPQKSIHRYAMTTVNSIIAYLMARNSAFDIEVFNSIDETPSSLQFALSEIKQKNYQVIIAPVTPIGASFLAQNGNDFLIFIPTIHYSSAPTAPSNILFGGINYNEQIQKLLNFSNPKIATFSDGSPLGAKLDFLVSQNTDIRYQKQITDSEKINLKYMLKGNQILKNASIFLNMPLVKSSILSSQLRVYDILPHSLLSTQINYHPTLLTLTQYLDRKRMYLANSISQAPLSVESTNTLFGHSIVYDWVNYSTNVGLDYLFATFFTQNNPRAFKEYIQGNQIIYNTKIMKASRYGFYTISNNDY